MRMKEFSEKSGLTKSQIVFYEGKGIFAPVKNAKGVRSFSDDDLRKSRLLNLCRMAFPEDDEYLNKVKFFMAFNDFGDSTREEIIKRMHNLTQALVEFNVVFGVKFQLLVDAEDIEVLDLDNFKNLGEGDERDYE